MHHYPRLQGYRRALARGFTLIELIAVIVIMAVLSTAAVTRFVDMRADAIVGSTDATAAALVDGLRIANSVWRLRAPNGGGVLNLPNYADGTADFAANGYPIGTAAITTTDILSNLRCMELFRLTVRGTPVTTMAEGYPAPRGTRFLALGGQTICGYYVLNSSGTLYEMGPGSCNLLLRYALNTWLGFSFPGAPASVDIAVEGSDCGTAQPAFRGVGLN